MTQVQATVAYLRNACATFWRRRAFFATVFVILMLCSLGVIYLIPRTYRVSANLLIVNGNSRSDPTLQPPDLPAIATSARVLERVRSSLNLRTTVKAMKSRLVAKAPAFKSGIMRLEYTDSTPARAALVANAVADELARTYDRLSKSRYEDDVHALDAELTKQKKRIERMNATLVAHGESADGPRADDKSGDGGSRGQEDHLPDLQMQRAVVKATLQGDIARLQAVAVDAATRKNLLRRDLLQDDPLYRALLNSANTAEAQLANVRAQYTERYAALRPIEAKVKRLNAAVADEAARAAASPYGYSPATEGALGAQRSAEALVTTDRAKFDALNQQIALLTRPAREVGAMVIVRLQRDAALAAYRAIAARLASSLADRADVLSLGSVVVVDRAIASDAQASVSSNRLIVTFALMALLLALIATFIAGQLDPRLHRVAQIEALYGRPVVATLGKSNQRSGAR
jgi:capsular polysaccharide biosynthesis protein